MKGKVLYIRPQDLRLVKLALRQKANDSERHGRADNAAILHEYIAILGEKQ